MFSFMPYISNHSIRRTSLDPRLLSVVLLAAFAWLAASLAAVAVAPVADEARAGDRGGHRNAAAAARH